jgi:hypothetical protein
MYIVHRGVSLFLSCDKVLVYPWYIYLTDTSCNSIYILSGIKDKVYLDDELKSFIALQTYQFSTVFSTWKFAKNKKLYFTSGRFPS